MFIKTDIISLIWCDVVSSAFSIPLRFILPINPIQIYSLRDLGHSNTYTKNTININKSNQYILNHLFAIS